MAEPIGKLSQISRRDFLRFGLGVTAEAAGIGILAACTPDQSRRTVASPTPIIAPKPAKEQLGDAWKALAPTTRIDLLERKAQPAGLDARRELALATAQFNCGQRTCAMTAEALAENVRFISSNQFVREAQKAQPGMPDEEVARFRTRMYEFVHPETNEIFFNTELFETVVRAAGERPGSKERYNGRDLVTLVEKATLFHAYGHVSESNTPISLSRPIPVSTQEQKLFIVGFQGLYPIISDEAGNQQLLNGTNEAAVEAAASILTSRTGMYVPVSNIYPDGARIINSLNQKSGISQDEFLKIQKGELALDTLLHKWGSIKNKQTPDLEAAILALAIIGLRVGETFQDDPRGAYSFKQTVEDVNKVLQTDLPVPAR